MYIYTHLYIENYIDPLKYTSKAAKKVPGPRSPLWFRQVAKPGHSRISSRGVATKVRQATRKGQRAVQKGKSPPDGFELLEPLAWLGG